MSRSGVARACALLALVAILATGCGSDDDDGVSAAGTTTTTTSTTTAGGGSSTTAATSTTTIADTTTTIEVTFANGSVVGGARTLSVPLDEKVRLKVTSDVADEVHVHTYDVTADVAAGQTATLELDATIPGRHEVELEERGKPLLILEVK